jgi:hypothetical protein
MRRSPLLNSFSRRRVSFSQTKINLELLVMLPGKLRVITQATRTKVDPEPLVMLSGKFKVMTQITNGILTVKFIGKLHIIP